MRFDVDATLAQCRAQHGVPALELDPVDLEGLKLLAGDAAGNARDAGEALRMYQWIVNQLAIRAQLERRRLDRPELRDVAVTAPVFIVAPGRTGSTLLQWLLALHPQLRAPRLWELWSPMYEDTEAGRRRVLEGCEAALRAFPPAALKLHPMAPDAPDECHWIMRHNSIQAGLGRSPAYIEWLWRIDAGVLAGLFQDYRRMVQMMLGPGSGARWLSKTFAHALFWPVLFDVFPDARVVRIHRDPRQVIASTASLFLHHTRNIGALEMGEGVAATTAGGLWRMLQADAAAPQAQVTDVMYAELRDAPARVAGDIVRWLGLPGVEGFEAKVTQYLSRRRRIRAAPHAAELEEFGLTDDGVLEQFEPYVDWVRRRLDAGFCR